MPSAWHTPDDPRELSDPPLDLPCDGGCGNTVTIAAEDWHDNDGFYCTDCVAAVVSRPHPVDAWPTDIPA